jgi:hypothetical protein
VYEPNKIHVIVDALSRLLDSIKPIGVFDQTKNESLFHIVLKLLNDVKENLKTK